MFNPLEYMQGKTCDCVGKRKGRRASGTGLYFAVILGAVLLSIGCDSETSGDGKTPTEDTAFAESCRASGGTVDGDRCVCGSVKCKDGIVCDAESGKCADDIDDPKVDPDDPKVDPTDPGHGNEGLKKCEPGTPDVCSVGGDGVAVLKKCFGGYLIEDKCELGCNSAGTGCSASFGDLCEGSGGRLSEDGLCICDGNTCPAGDVCVSDSIRMKCASEITIGECTDGETKCTNRMDGRGEIYTCVEGAWVKDDAGCAGACDRQGKQCGKDGCIDFVKECRDDLMKDSTGGGAIAECQYGEWQILQSCTDGFSCVDEYNCGECMNGNKKCVDYEVRNIVNRYCSNITNKAHCESNSECDCQRDSNGNLKYVDGTIGVLLLCEHGKWSDPNDLTRSSYCPEVKHIFTKYEYGKGLVNWESPMTWIYRLYNGKVVHDEYHYSSCHNDECGECNNNYTVCEDREQGNKLIGNKYQCQHGVLVTSMSCINQLCKNEFECK